MPNKYCNLDGTKFISEEFEKINAGFSEVENDINEHKADNTAHGGIYHKNLLHNWDFSVWQRGTTFGATGATALYAADRWRTQYHDGIERIDNTCPLKNKYALKIKTVNIISNGSWLTQVFENLNGIVGKTLTLSAYVKVSKECRLRFFANSVLKKEFIANAGVWVLYTNTFAIPEEGLTSIQIGTGAITAGETLEIGAVKLEYGDISTLDNDPPADYGEQLLICQRYYQRHTTNTIADMDLRPSMRITPTKTAITGGYAYSADL